MAKSLTNCEFGDPYPHFPEGQRVESLPSRTSKKHLFLAFLTGILACSAVTQLSNNQRTFNYADRSSVSQEVNVAPPYVGSTEVHTYPPAHPTNANPTLFPSDVGYPGGTPTGAEPGVVLTAPTYPLHTGAAQLVKPTGKAKDSRDFDLFKKWGTLSPWYSVGKGAFGLDSDPTVPETCRVTGLHLLHRHGARYPTRWCKSDFWSMLDSWETDSSLASYGGPTKLADKLNNAAANWTATGELDFLNSWTYKLGEELLTPFGRQQLYDLGVSMRLKYGFLLEVSYSIYISGPLVQLDHRTSRKPTPFPFFEPNLSLDRMLYSALNFAIGFFGYPLDGKYQQSITIEAQGFSNSLAPYMTCSNAWKADKGGRGVYYVKRWAEIYLKKALSRLRRYLKGFDLSIEDVYMMQQMCAYETVAIGYSKFCELFTKQDWEGFNYAYESSFGSPVARVQGYGWIKELVARLTHTKITEHNLATNATLDDNTTTFPLDHSLYVDATHEAVILNIITALNLTNFAEAGPLPYTHIPHKRSFETSKLAPFATNVQFQLLECASIPDPQIRIIINDGVAPLTSIDGCPKQHDGMCPVDAFVKAQKAILAEIDWDYECKGNWTVPEGPEWTTTTGTPPKDVVGV
ncbi:hypothetical protein H0H92_008243 [Tricholoma furcatifolium]|nr:hypothetical protein H0H92_008243 [Tricholoma furcatifolium]